MDTSQLSSLTTVSFQNSNTKNSKRFNTYSRSNSAPCTTGKSELIDTSRLLKNKRKLKKQVVEEEEEDLDEEDELSSEEDEEEIELPIEEDKTDKNELPSTSMTLDNKLENSCKLSKLEDDDYDAE